MRSLWVKLTLAFLFTSLIGVVLFPIMTQRVTLRLLERDIRTEIEANLSRQVTAYYLEHGSWEGVQEEIGERRGPEARGGPPGESRRPELPESPPYMLVDPDGLVLVKYNDFRLGVVLPQEQLSEGIPVEMDGQTIGFLVATGEPVPIGPGEARVLSAIKTVALWVAISGGLLALIAGTILAGALTRPLRELTAAAQRMATGDLGQQVNVQSRDEIGQLASAFNQMSADLADADELRRQMTANIAHDLRTPLAVISGHVEGMNDGVLTPNEDRFKVMQAESQHLQRLVEDLRTLSLADAGQLTLYQTPSPPHDLLERASAAFAQQARHKEVTIDVEIGKTLPRINVDPQRIAQVLGNLISNALRYTPQGGSIHLKADGSDNGVRLTVQDTGKGIPTEELPRVFERFYRVDASRQDNGEESGLGLTIARSIVEAHGGTIEAESGVGKGTSMIIILPT